MGFFWDHFGMGLGSFWERFGIAIDAATAVANMNAELAKID